LTVSAALTALIMAAGEGTRMRSSLPKVLHPVCGRPMVAWPILAAKQAGAGRVAVIVSPDRDLSPALPNGTETVVQRVADGTGGAMRAALKLIRESETVIVLSGDHPLISTESIAELLSTHEQAGAAATVMTIELDDPGAYGRIVRDAEGELERIVEAKEPTEATPEELAIREVNAGTYAFDAQRLADAIERIDNDNSAGEYYVGDVLPLLRADGLKVAAFRSFDTAVTMGVNDRAQLARAAAEARRRLLDAHMLAGVTIIDPDSTWIDADVELAPDVTIEPGCHLRGASSVGAGSVIGPMTTLTDARIGENVTVPHSYLVECQVADGAAIGPFAHLRPGAEIGEGAKAGSFVEIKNSEIGAGAKVPHLSYVGDADVGEGSNLGASTITANYDGFRKNRTKIGKNVRTGVDTTLVAPVEVGDDAYTGAGSVIDEDVPKGALGIARPEQRNVEGYAKRKAKESKGSS
jgi:bifunctional UDP-N-acetylglucosamine pyrophosphorylase / glucosamine-1-phosphate N-acetyltransferase